MTNESTSSGDVENIAVTSMKELDLEEQQRQESCRHNSLNIEKSGEDGYGIHCYNCGYKRITPNQEGLFKILSGVVLR